MANRGIILRVLFLFIPILNNVGLLGQEGRGLFPIRNYSSKEYKELPQNWAIIQDNRGLMYFGNNAGVMEYDGVSWRTITISNETIVRSLAIDKKSNTIYVGAAGEIGYLAPDSSNKLYFVSLLEKLAYGEKEFSDVWRTHVLNDGKVFFQSSEKIMIWDGSRMQVHKPQKTFHLSFLINDRLYVRDTEAGILKWENNQFQLVPGTEILAKEKVYFMLPLSENNILINTRDQGLMLFQLPSAAFPYAKIMPFKSNCNDLIVNSLVYNAIRVSPTLISIGSLNAGVMLIDTAGNLVNHFTKKEGLQQETVYYQFVDSENKLWLALANGISKIDILSPITFFNDTKGIEGSIKAIAQFNNRIYVATNNGIFYLNPGDVVFQKVSGFETECWDIKIYDKYLLIASNMGLYALDYDNKLQLINTDVAFSLKVSEVDSMLLYVGKESGFSCLLNLKENIFEIKENVSEIISIQDEDDSHIWLGTNGNGIIELIKEDGVFKALKYNSSNGFVDGSVWVAKFGGQVILATDKGLYTVKRDKRKTSFELFNAGDFILGNLIGIHRAFVYNNKLWLSVYSNAKKEAESVGYLVGDKNSGFNWEESPFLKMPKEIAHAIYCDNKQIVWIGRPDGLYRYDNKLSGENKHTYTAVIRKIVIGKDSVLYGGAGLTSGNEDNAKLLPYAFNSVSFSYAFNSFEDETRNIYSFMLEGNDDTWSNWSYDTKANYTNLREGTYFFRVKARNVYGKESAEAVFSFVILPPWYRTWWAYLSYLLLFILTVWGVVTWSTSSLRKIIAERTAEISFQKEELDFKNKEITDSINYAQRLQNAILPYIDEIKSRLPDVFVFYKPRDIVSGDLYWYADKGNSIYLASIDCTGHGVPGAFLSVVANSALNEIVNDTAGDLLPNIILQKLDEKITHTLKQGGQFSLTRDGMDIALCMIDFNTNTLYYSGANRPLYFIRNSELEKIKGDKFPIGGGYDTQKQFSVLHKQLLKGDVFYLFSDGYADQFGGPEGKKFMIKRFGELLLKISGIPMEEQKKKLKNEIAEWQGDYESVDDILVIGVKI